MRFVRLHPKTLAFSLFVISSITSLILQTQCNTDFADYNDDEDYDAPNGTELNFTETNSCSNIQFQCHQTKKCIPNRYRCDGDRDCGNGDLSDEDGCRNLNECDGRDEVLCKVNKKCINSSLVCDNKNDCGEGDFTDETNCAVCPKNGYRCDAGTNCIPPELKCNGFHDCADLSDEVDCDSCMPNSFLCNKTYTCLPLSFKCDGEVNSFPNGTDINNCESCSHFGLLCNTTKKCITIFERCDGYFDCGGEDKSDEENCETCLANQFQCKTSKKCIHSRQRCSAVMDCGDGDNSDEENCGLCPPYTFQCNITKQCIRFDRRCNGEMDCGTEDNSDEVNCDSCPGDAFECLINNKTTCLPRILWCDGNEHCPDGSDEENCETCSKSSVHCKSTNVCTPINSPLDARCPNDSLSFIKALQSIYKDSFQCKTTGHYVNQGLRCDGFPDCGPNDSSDEEDCDKCESWGIQWHIHHLFHCSRSRKCLPFFRTCDGVYDCGIPDYSDEENCGDSVSYTEIGSFNLTLDTTNVTYLLRNSFGTKLQIDTKKYELLVNQAGNESTAYYVVLEINNATVEDSGNYTLTVIVVDGNGKTKVYNFYFTVIVKSIGPVFPEISYTNLQNSTLSFTPGKVLKLLCVIANTTRSVQPEVIWEWQNISMNDWYPTLNYSFENSFQELILVAIPMDKPGRFTCTASNSIGSVSVYADIVIETLDATSNHLLGPIGGALSFLVLGGVVLGFWYKCKQKQLDRTFGGLTEMEFYNGCLENLDPNISMKEQANLLPFQKDKWEIAREKLELGTLLGSGAFGLVLKAQLHDKEENGDEESSPVAVKTVKACAEESQFKALVMELKVMANLGKHLNIVNLIGACTENFTKTRELLIVMEFCKYGSLLSYLLDNRNSFVNQLNSETDQIDSTICGAEEGKQGTLVEQSEDRTTVILEDSNETPSDYYMGDYQMQEITSITTTDLLSWAFQIAKGMEYLSGIKILHGDLAARNILLADNKIAKICDFGYARETFQNYDYQKDTKGQLLPIKWMAIESLYHGIFSSKSDCWSYGILLWELFTLGNKPYPGLQAGEEFCQKLSDGYRMEKPLNSPKPVYQIMMDCWKEEPAERPTFSNISNLLLQNMPKVEQKRILEMVDVYTTLNEVDTNLPGQTESMGLVSSLGDQEKSSQYGPEPTCSILVNSSKANPEVRFSSFRSSTSSGVKLKRY